MAEFARRSGLLDDWCAKVGRDPREIGRTVMIDAPQTGLAEAFAAAGATEIIVSVPGPFDLAPVRELLALRDGLAAR